MSTEEQKRFYIAVVDDESELVYLFRDVLNQIEGVTVFGFTDPIAALQHITLNHEDYKLILTDLRMPALGGIELIKKIKNISPSIVTLLMTAFEVNNDELFQESMKNQIIDGFLQKPIMTKKLLYEIHKQVKQILEPNHNNNHGSVLSF